MKILRSRARRVRCGQNLTRRLLEVECPRSVNLILRSNLSRTVGRHLGTYQFLQDAFPTLSSLISEIYPYDLEPISILDIDILATSDRTKS